MYSERWEGGGHTQSRIDGKIQDIDNALNCSKLKLCQVLSLLYVARVTLPSNTCILLIFPCNVT